ncbi:MAG: Ion transport 2 domain protein [Frankiales bacterium]|nr:Ion transport 2 domain protein [Frankiales bacterium]
MVAATAAASTVHLLEEGGHHAHLHADGERPWSEEVDEPALHRWNQAMTTPLLVMSVLFVVVLVVPALVVDLPHVARTVLRVANVVIWLFFAVDYVGRLRLAVDRKRFVRTHVVDLLVVVLPFARPLRLLRLASVAGRLGKQTRGGLVADVTKLVTLASVFTAFLGACLALDAERNAAGTTIANFPDALWWALGTMTAVPYGDVYPVTQEGRLVSAALMILGLVFVGLITAAIAAWFVGFIGGEEEDAATSAELQAVQERLIAVEALLLQLVALPQQRQAPVEAPARRPRTTTAARRTTADDAPAVRRARAPRSTDA